MLTVKRNQDTRRTHFHKMWLTNMRQMTTSAGPLKSQSRLNRWSAVLLCLFVAKLLVACMHALQKWRSECSVPEMLSSFEATTAWDILRHRMEKTQKLLLEATPDLNPHKRLTLALNSRAFQRTSHIVRLFKMRRRVKLLVDAWSPIRWQLDLATKEHLEPIRLPLDGRELEAGVSLIEALRGQHMDTNVPRSVPLRIFHFEFLEDVLVSKMVELASRGTETSCQRIMEVVESICKPGGKEFSEFGSTPFTSTQMSTGTLSVHDTGTGISTDTVPAGTVLTLDFETMRDLALQDCVGVQA